MSPEKDRQSNDVYEAQIVAAQNMAEWFSGFLQGTDDIQEMPDLTQQRLSLQFGEGDMGMHLGVIRDSFSDLDQETQAALALYLCGYPEKALMLFCDKTSQDIRYELDEIFTPLLEEERLSAAAFGKAAVLRVASWPVRAKTPWPESLIDDADDEDWQVRGLCVQVDPELFFPEKGGSGAAKEAKRVCASCEVKKQCLEFALENDERFGIWGGLSERERRKLLRKRRAG